MEGILRFVQSYVHVHMGQIVNTLIFFTEIRSILLKKTTTKKIHCISNGRAFTKLGVNINKKIHTPRSDQREDVK